MKADEEILSEENNIIKSGDKKNCCGKCAGKNNRQNAHCGKIYVVKEGVLEEVNRERSRSKCSA